MWIGHRKKIRKPKFRALGAERAEPAETASSLKCM